MIARRTLLAAMPLWALTTSKAAAANVPTELSRELPGARLQGQGRLTFLGIHVYDIRLWAGEAPVVQGWPTAPLALELVYERSIKGSQIAERSLKEMKRLVPTPPARAAEWLSGMKQLFPDVKKGDHITGLHLPGIGARFFFNGQLKGDLRDPEFARLFFGIWLSEKTPEPALRDALLGQVK